MMLDLRDRLVARGMATLAFDGGAVGVGTLMQRGVDGS